MSLLSASPLLGESRADAGLEELVCASLSPLGGWFSIWQLCSGQSPSCSAWCRSLEEVGAGLGGEWGMALGDTPVKVCAERSLVFSFFCGNLESYHQNVRFLFRKPHFPLKMKVHKNVLPDLLKTLLLDGK